VVSVSNFFSKISFFTNEILVWVLSLIFYFQLLFISLFEIPIGLKNLIKHGKMEFPKMIEIWWCPSQTFWCTSPSHRSTLRGDYFLGGEIMEFIRGIETLACQNADCKDHGCRGKGNLFFRGWSGIGKRIRMFHCATCGSCFSERRGTPLFESRLSDEVAISIMDHLREGCGTRSTSRLVKVSKDTVTRYARLCGKHAQAAHDELVSFSPSDS
jgi:LacI family transcriptional regulator